MNEGITVHHSEHHSVLFLVLLTAYCVKKQKKKQMRTMVISCQWNIGGHKAVPGKGQFHCVYYKSSPMFKCTMATAHSILMTEL